MSKDVIHPLKWKKENWAYTCNSLLCCYCIEKKFECWGILCWGVNWGVYEVNSPQLELRGWFKSWDLESGEALRSCTRVYANRRSRKLNPRVG